MESTPDEIADLKVIKAAYGLQLDLLKYANGLLRSTKGSLLLKTFLQQVLQSYLRLTQAESGSIFLLDTNGLVLESILARGPLIRDLKQSLIGKVLDQGLAGWVRLEQKVGVIHDTLTDDRWLQLISEPYTARSALGIPFVRNRTVIGIVTLMHPNLNFFEVTLVKLVEQTMEPIALLLDNVSLQVQPPHL